MKYKEHLFEIVSGSYSYDEKAVLKCGFCKTKMNVPNNKGDLVVTCPTCKIKFDFKLKFYKLKKKLGLIISIFVGLLVALMISFLNSAFNLCGFYVFFIIPAGAFLFGIISNLGFLCSLACLKSLNLAYSKALVLLIAGFIAIFSFWATEYFIYSNGSLQINYVSSNNSGEKKIVKTEKVAFSDYYNNFGQYFKSSLKNKSIDFHIGIGKTSSPMVINGGTIGPIHIGAFAIVFLILKHICLLFSLPIYWLFYFS